MTLVNGKMFVYGGLTEGGRVNDILRIFDISTNNWLPPFTM
jgi:hypothetical protein